MKLTDFTSLLKNTAEAGAQKAIDDAGVLPSCLSKSEAYRLYGRATIDRWIQEGLIVPTARNGKILHKCIDRFKLDAIAHSSNRITYLPVAER